MSDDPQRARMAYLAMVGLADLSMTRFNELGERAVQLDREKRKSKKVRAKEKKRKAKNKAAKKSRRK